MSEHKRFTSDGLPSFEQETKPVEHIVPTPIVPAEEKAGVEPLPADLDEIAGLLRAVEAENTATPEPTVTPTPTMPEAPKPAEPTEDDENVDREALVKNLKTVSVPYVPRSSVEEQLKEDNKVEKAKEDLVDIGINVDNYLLAETIDGNKPDFNEVEYRKAILSGLIGKLDLDDPFTDNEIHAALGIGYEAKSVTEEQRRRLELQEVVMKVPGVPGEIARPAQLVRPVEQEVVVPRPGELSIDEQIDNIRQSFTPTEQRDAYEKLKGTLVGKSPTEIQKVKDALKQLDVDVKEEIERYDRLGEMRPELNGAMKEYLSLLEDRYDSSGAMLGPANTIFDKEFADRLTAMKKLGPDGVELATELEKELTAIAALHDLRQLVNTGASAEELQKSATRLKGEELITLIHLEDRQVNNDPDGKDYVLKCLASIDEKARVDYLDQSGTKVFKLEDPQLEKNICRETKSNKLYYMMARDLYRVTGGAARFEVAGWAHEDSSKGNQIVIEKNPDKLNGLIFRKAINARRIVLGEAELVGGVYQRKFQYLARHLDPGIKSFWEEVWSKSIARSPNDAVGRRFGYQQETTALGEDRIAGIPPRDYAVLTVEALRSLQYIDGEPDDVILGNETPLSVWMKDVGEAEAAMSTEIAFMNNPSFETFKRLYDPEKILGKFPKTRVDGKTVDKLHYILDGLGDYVTDLMIKGRLSETQIGEKLRAYAASEYLFNADTNIKVESFMEKYKLPTNVATGAISKIKTVGKNVVGSDKQKRFESLGIIGKFAKTGVDIFGFLVKLISNS